VSCRVCETLTPAHLVELDALLGDPMRWPSTLFEGFTPPTDGLPASYRQMGAKRLGIEWLKTHGYAITGRVLETHIRFDVPVQAVDVEELVRRGMVVLGHDKRDTGDAIDPLRYIAFYNAGVNVGLRGLELLAKRIETMIEAKEEVPLPLLKMVVDLGAKLAMSQASIRAAGKPFGDGGDEDDAFRAGEDASPRFNGVRVRQVDGVSRPVADEGKADRDHYNERMRHEGGAPIGGR
jgi:hypothetical protein